MAKDPRSLAHLVRIVHVTPSLDCGRTPIKRTVGDSLEISAEIVSTSPLLLGASVRFRAVGQRQWTETRLSRDPFDLDRYFAEVHLTSIGPWQYAIDAWIDRAANWRDELRRRSTGGDTEIDLRLEEGNHRFGTTFSTVEEALESNFEDRQAMVRSDVYLVDVDPKRARFGSWYELFPRSFGGLSKLADQLPRIAELGFDVLYLPPIHPIGQTNRKGPNNSLVATASDPGSPWAIGDKTGGHTAIHRDLGTIKEFDRLVQKARKLDIDIALDLALQCSVDHPWLREHPEWFAWRSDGTIRFAENPPKRYEDIVNFNFESKQWQELWNAILGVVRYWVDHGVRIFRVDNPHTKPLPMWQWLIAEIRKTDPEVFFLAEAFTRPALMRGLAKAGFSQSYTYFTWRNTKAEITSYIGELAGPLHEYFRPNFFVNTPDILTEYLQYGGPPAFHARAVLAATLSPSYGVYSGFEYFEGEPAHEHSEEYLDSEKYEIKARDLDGPLFSTIARLNEIRRSSVAFQSLDNVTFVDTANDQLIAYVKKSARLAPEFFVVCVNLDPTWTQQGLLDIPGSLGIPDQFAVSDLLNTGEYSWHVGGNYVQLAPGAAHVMKVR